MLGPLQEARHEMMSTMPDVSVILPILHAGNDYLRCLYSIRAALVGRTTYEIICVVRDIEEFTGSTGPDLHFFQEAVPGIYAAMNLGLQKAAGRYLYFLGQDDVLLPSAAQAIIQGKASNADIIIADVFWGERRVYRNSPSKNVLVWKNLCHQGLFYDRLKFINAVGVYPVQFEVQADHYANIIFSSIVGLKIFKYTGCIAWYSSDGFSSRTLDAEFRCAFPMLVRKHIGVVSFYIVVARRFLLKLFRLVRNVK